MYEDITYFNKPGIENTTQTLQIVKKYAVKKGINQILVASTYGYTIEKALEIFKELDVKFIVIGGKRKYFPEALYDKLVEKDHLIVFNSEYNFQYPEIVWEVLRRFSEGMKVCVQMNLMVSDLELLPIGEELIAIAGTGREDFPSGGGADTAVILETVKSSDFFKLDLPQSKTKIIGRKIKEILCKPR
ncbi:hypothetical protein JW865_00015 [Candidatus Bathyarchaeota archaeon]|nr:hypothetical protein [Candidatus Bathyarchaeota archaeon]